MGLGTSHMFPNGADVWSATASAPTEPYRFMKQTTTAEESYRVAPAAATEPILGISIAGAASGEPVGVCTSSIGALRVNGGTTPIAAGDKLASITADGIGGKVATGEYGAIALEPATADGALIRVLIRSGVA
jgi:hypothetical protein